MRKKTKEDVSTKGYPDPKPDLDRFVALLHTARRFALVRQLTSREIRRAIREVFGVARSRTSRPDPRQLSLLERVLERHGS